MSGEKEQRVLCMMCGTECTVHTKVYTREVYVKLPSRTCGVTRSANHVSNLNLRAQDGQTRDLEHDHNLAHTV